MSEESIAHKTLTRARFFVDQAEKCDTSHREEFEHFVYAAIVFARSITNYIQKEYKHSAGFDVWYSQKREEMRSDPLLKFFYKARTSILKKRLLGIGRSVILKIQSVFSRTLVGEVDFKVTRHKLWYRRKPKILWEDIQATIIGPIRKWYRKRRSEQKRPQVQEEPVIESIDYFFFDDPAWKDKPAVDLLRECLDKLEIIVDEADKRFGSKH